MRCSPHETTRLLDWLLAAKLKAEEEQRLREERAAKAQAQSEAEAREREVAWADALATVEKSNAQFDKLTDAAFARLEKARAKLEAREGQAQETEDDDGEEVNSPV